MTSEDRATQSKVGTFILIGLITIAVMVVYFGRLGEGVASYYNLRVEFPNASGLLRGAEVLLAGARIGRVVTSPTMLANMDGVYVNLRVLDNVKIPSASEFVVGSAGLLGDKYVEIRLKPNAKGSKMIEPNTTIQGGSDGGGISGMADSAAELMPKLQAAVENINSIAKKIDAGVLTPEGIKSISETVKNFQTTSAAFVIASGKVDAVVAKVDAVVGKVDKVATQAEGAISSGKEAMDSGKKAADELQRALADTRSLLRDAKQGQGTLGMLLSNREAADNLRSLISNLKRYGILWYRDGEKAKSPAPPR